MIILLFLTFQDPTDFIKELVIQNPNLKDEGLRNVNKQLMREKIYLHVEQYIADYLPGVAFEQFLISHVLVKGGPAFKPIPYF